MKSKFTHEEKQAIFKGSDYNRRFTDKKDIFTFLVQV